MFLITSFIFPLKYILHYVIIILLFHYINFLKNIFKITFTIWIVVDTYWKTWSRQTFVRENFKAGGD